MIITGFAAVKPAGAFFVSSLAALSAADEREANSGEGHASLDVEQLAQALKPRPEEEAQFLQLQDVRPLSVHLSVHFRLHDYSFVISFQPSNTDINTVCSEDLLPGQSLGMCRLPYPSVQLCPHHLPCFHTNLSCNRLHMHHLCTLRPGLILSACPPACLMPYLQPYCMYSHCICHSAISLLTPSNQATQHLHHRSHMVLPSITRLYGLSTKPSFAQAPHPRSCPCPAYYDMLTIMCCDVLTQSMLAKESRQSAVYVYCIQLCRLESYAGWDPALTGILLCDLSLCWCVQVSPTSVAFRGLAVRMGIATGRVLRITTHPLSRRTVYHGPLVQLVETVVGVAHGGQIIADSATFTAMSPNLHEIAGRVSSQPDYTAMMAHTR